MQKDKKSKKANIDKLHDILDEASYRDLPPENEKYLQSLNKRIKSSSDEIQLYKKIAAKKSAEEDDSLESKVTIHLREPRKKIEIPEVKIEEIKPEVEEAPPIEDAKKPYEDEDIIEIEKVEFKDPQFVEVKPKVITKEEEEPPVKERKAIGDVELTEWEPIDKKDEEKITQEKPDWEPTEEEVIIKKEERVIEKTPIEKEKVEEESKFCPDCGAKTPIDGKFCPQCGFIFKDEDAVTIKPTEPTPSFIPVKKVEEEDGSLKWDPIDIDKDTMGETPTEVIEEEEIIKIEDKIDAFKDIKSINDETAFLFYDNGFTTIDSLSKATVDDLTNGTGIKKKLAKKIKKEIDKKIVESAKVKPIAMGNSAEGEVTEEQIKQEVIGKSDVEVPLPVELSQKLEEWEPTEEIEVEEPEELQIEKNKKIDVFTDIKSINEEIAVLLIDNGIDSIDALNKKTIKELTKIRGIKKKIAKQIKKEVADSIINDTNNFDNSEIEIFKSEEKPSAKEESDEWESFEEEKVEDSKMSEIEGFMRGDYTLYEKKIETKTGKKRIVRFFSKAEPEGGEPIDLPKGFEVKVNSKTGLPYLKKKK